MMKKLMLLTMIGVMVGLLLAGCAGSQQSPGTESSKPGSSSDQNSTAGPGAEKNEAVKPLDMVFANGRQGGSQYPLSVAITQLLEKLPEINTTTIQPGGGAANIVAVDEGKAEMAMTFSTSTYDGYAGNPPYNNKAANITEMFALQPFNQVVWVGRDSGIQSIEDLKGKRVNVGPAGFTSGIISQMVFDAYGITQEVKLENLEITDSVEQLKDGHIDAISYGATDNFAALIDLAQVRNMKVLAYDPAKLQEVISKGGGLYTRNFPPSGIYRDVEPVEAIAYANNVIAHKDLISEDLAYTIVKTVAEKFSEIQKVDPSVAAMDVKGLAQDVGIPYHPGALKYFKEKGWK